MQKPYEILSADSREALVELVNAWLQAGYVRPDAAVPFVVDGQWNQCLVRPARAKR